MLKGKNSLIKTNVPIAEAMYLLVMEASDIAQAAKPGQFVHLSIPGDPSKILRRPISIHQADRTTGDLSLVYQVVGDGTRRLAMQPAGTSLSVLGPLGRGFSVGAAQTIYLAGGGCGIAPLSFVLDQWPDRRYQAFLGYRSQAHVHLEDQFHHLSEGVHVATNDGSYGTGGFVTDLLIGGIEKMWPDLLLACGPDPMLSKIQQIAKAYQIPCQISLEERMGCGIGGCLVCACAVIKGTELDYKRVCADGPVFDSREVIF